jgi:SAM-dependent methyltransferase
MSSFTSPREFVVDYGSYNFHAVWDGRDRVDRYDRALLDLALRHLDPRRLLELGTGFGRLSPRLREWAEEYAAVDFDPRGLREAKEVVTHLPTTRGHQLWIAANAYHLPFRSESFSSIAMVRVHHHLAEPRTALGEIARVLVPGGSALITYSPISWVRSLVHDLGVAFGRPKQANDRRLLFAPGDHVQVREVPLRQFITAEERFDQDLAAAGLVKRRSFGGTETAVARVLPLDVGLRWSEVWPRAPVFSTRWVVVHKPGPMSAVSPWEEILTCPRCQQPGPPMYGDSVLPGPCPRCGFPFLREEGLLDGRYVAGSGVGPVRQGAGPGRFEPPAPAELGPGSCRPPSPVGTRPGPP